MDDALLADNRGRDLESRFCRLSDPAGQGSGGATARALNYTWRDHDMLYRKVIRRGLRMAGRPGKHTTVRTLANSLP